MDKHLELFFKEKQKIIKDTIVKFPHYSISDIKFRLVRDKLLSQAEYKKIMFTMFEEKKFKSEDCYKIVFLNDIFIQINRNLNDNILKHIMRFSL